jgi:glycolate oxidase
MALSKDIYKALEDVVGVENICQDPAIMPSYHSSNLGAVVLPKNTEEVQAIVRLCKKYDLGFSVMSTGFIRARIPEGVIYLDMRRMNHIIEINEKNMYAVVEPYVTSGELQAELMKRGLNCSIKGSGSNCTAVLRGHGHMDQSTGGDDRNQLAMEMVTSEGDILETGSFGASGEWFCGDGPGPSLRGIVCGVAHDRIGIITKSAMKLYHWPGPSRFPIKGVSPRYTLSEMPPNFMVRYFSFPSIEKMYQAELKIGESEISFELMGFNAAMVASNISPSIEDEMANYKLLKDSVQGPGFVLIIAANSPEEFEYDKKVLQKIISDAEGKSLELAEDPKIADLLLIHGVRISASIRETFRYRVPGGAAYGYPVMGQRDLNIRWMQEAAQRKAVLISKGLIADDGGVFFGWGVEHGHLGKTEIFCDPAVASPECIQAAKDWQKETGMRALDGCFALPIHLPMDIVGPRMSNFHLWEKKIKQAFDPKARNVNLGSHMG